MYFKFSKVQLLFDANHENQILHEKINIYYDELDKCLELKKSNEELNNYIMEIVGRIKKIFNLMNLKDCKEELNKINFYQN